MSKRQNGCPISEEIRQRKRAGRRGEERDRLLAPLLALGTNSASSALPHGGQVAGTPRLVDPVLALLLLELAVAMAQDLRVGRLKLFELLLIQGLEALRKKRHLRRSKPQPLFDLEDLVLERDALLAKRLAHLFLCGEGLIGFFVQISEPLMQPGEFFAVEHEWIVAGDDLSFEASMQGVHLTEEMNTARAKLLAELACGAPDGARVGRNHGLGVECREFVHGCLALFGLDDVATLLLEKLGELLGLGKDDAVAVSPLVDARDDLDGLPRGLGEILLRLHAEGLDELLLGEEELETKLPARSGYRHSGLVLVGEQTNERLETTDEIENESLVHCGMSFRHA